MDSLAVETTPGKNPGDNSREGKLRLHENQTRRMWNLFLGALSIRQPHLDSRTACTASDKPKFPWPRPKGGIFDSGLMNARINGLENVYFETRLITTSLVSPVQVGSPAHRHGKRPVSSVTAVAISAPVMDFLSDHLDNFDLEITHSHIFDVPQPLRVSGYHPTLTILEPLLLI